MTRIVICVIKDEIPSFSAPAKARKSGRKLRGRSRKVLVRKKYQTQMRNETSCPRTVAHAAPAADLLAMLVSGALMIGYFRQLGKDVPAAEAE